MPAVMLTPSLRSVVSITVGYSKGTPRWVKASSEQIVAKIDTGFCRCPKNGLRINRIQQKLIRYNLLKLLELFLKKKNRRAVRQ